MLQRCGKFSLSYTGTWHFDHLLSPLCKETTTFGDFIPDNVHQCHRDGKSVARNGTVNLHRAKSVVKADPCCTGSTIR